MNAHNQLQSDVNPRASATKKKSDLVKKCILEKIAKNFWKEGDRLPPIRSLEDEYKVNKLTVHKALKELAGCGVIDTLSRQGNYVISIGRAREELYSSNKEQIAFILPRWIQNGATNPSFSEMLSGASDAATSSGINLVYASLPWQKDETIFSLDELKLANRRISGALLVGPAPDHIVQHFISQAGIPVILLDNLSDQPGITCISSDNLGGAARAVKYLYENGHRRIGMVSVKPGKMRLNERFAGFYAEMHRLSLLNQIAFVHEEGWNDDTCEGGIKAGTTLAKNGLNDATAILALNDNMAMGMLQAFQMHNIKVPAQVSVMGIGDEPGANTVSHPPLTTMQVNRYNLGKLGVHILLDIMRNQRPCEEIILQPMILKVRASVNAICIERDFSEVAKFRAEGECIMRGEFTEGIRH
jgi:LacI family transcriptional regulator